MFPPLKDRLNKYREKERDIDNQIERLERLTAKMTGVGAQVITDMPRAPGTSIDRIAVMVSEKEELERENPRGCEKPGRILERGGRSLVQAKTL